MTLMKMKFTYKLLMLVFILSIISSVYTFDCDQSLGCLLKKKFYGYISSSDTRGEPHKMESNINYKNIFVFRDKIVFYKASLPQENIAENEIPNLNPEMNESNIERLIPFLNATKRDWSTLRIFCEESVDPLDCLSILNNKLIKLFNIK